MMMMIIIIIIISLHRCQRKHSHAEIHSRNRLQEASTQKPERVKELQQSCSKMEESGLILSIIH